jgi:hypothetical protein
MCSLHLLTRVTSAWYRRWVIISCSILFSHSWAACCHLLHLKLQLLVDHKRSSYTRPPYADDLDTEYRPRSGNSYSCAAASALSLSLRNLHGVWDQQQEWSVLLCIADRARLGYVSKLLGTSNYNLRPEKKKTPPFSKTHTQLWKTFRKIHF